MATNLRTQSVVAAAPQELCFEVVAAAGRKLSDVSPGERIVEFKTGYRGREIVIVERLKLNRPERIEYEWLEGPLPHVRESISFAAEGDGRTRITYEGTFEVSGGVVARLIARLRIKPAFERIVREHLEEGKQIAERRAGRSHLWPRVAHAGSRDAGRTETNGATR